MIPLLLVILIIGTFLILNNQFNKKIPSILPSITQLSTSISTSTSLIPSPTILLASDLIYTNTKIFEKFVNETYLNKINPELNDVPLLIDYSYAGYKNSEEEIKIKNTKIFNVLDFGADKTGNEYSIDAIQAAVNEAKANGGGIIYFPNGTYKLNDTDDSSHRIIIDSSNIVLQGEDMYKTIIYLDKPYILSAGHTSIYFNIRSTSTNKTTIIQNAPRGSRYIKVISINGYNVGDLINIFTEGDTQQIYINKYYEDVPLLSVWNTSYAAPSFHYEIEDIDIINKIIKIKGVLHTFILANVFYVVKKNNYLDNCGVENFTFKGRGDYLDINGNILNAAIHHYGARKDVIDAVGKERANILNTLHDYSWNGVSFANCKNMWIRNVINETTSKLGNFEHTTCNGTAENLIFQGKIGHHSFVAQGTNHLVRNIIMNTKNIHGPGITRVSAGVVLKDIKLFNNQTTDFHGRNAISNLLDNVSNGIMTSHGGADDTHPAHGRWLTFWNFFHQTDKTYIYDFWDMKQTGINAIIKPIVVGFGKTVTEVKNADYVEKLNDVGDIYPLSLFDAQLRLRLYVNNIKVPTKSSTNTTSNASTTTSTTTRLNPSTSTSRVTP